MKQKTTEAAASTSRPFADIGVQSRTHGFLTPNRPKRESSRYRELGTWRIIGFYLNGFSSSWRRCESWMNLHRRFVDSKAKNDGPMDVGTLF